MDSSAPIAPLPPQVVAQIRSSISITSLNGVIIELVKNSRDAGATKIDIQFSRDRGNCMVQDDGFGITPSEFQPEGGLARPHHSSKHATITTPTHGSLGCFLASLSALSIVTITSKHFKHHSQNSITLSGGAVTSRRIPAPPEACIPGITGSGTRVVVYNLFGDMPVRVKHRAVEASDTSLNLKNWDNLRKEIAGLLLFWPGHVTVTMKEGSAREIRMSYVRRRRLSPEIPLNHILQVLYQARFLSSIKPTSWNEVKGSTSSFQLQGGICLEPAPTKNVQFMSFGIVPILNDGRRNVLYEDINRIFANSLFGIDDELPELDERERRRRAEDRRFKTDGYTNKELRGSGKGVDRWPMFCMRIDVKERWTRKSPDDLFEDDHALASITNLIQRVVVEFLKDNNLMPKHVPHQQYQQSPAKRDRYGNLVNAHEFQPQPRNFTDDSPRKRGLPAPGPNSFSPSQQLRRSEMSQDSADASILRTASPFDIWPRVRSGRTINAPSMPKPSPLEPNFSPAPLSHPHFQSHMRAPATPLTSSHFTTPAPLSHSTFPPPTRTPATPVTSSHFAPPDSIVSKEGKVLRLPFLDVDRTSGSRVGSPRPRTPTTNITGANHNNKATSSSLMEDSTQVNQQLIDEADASITPDREPIPEPTRSKSASTTAQLEDDAVGILSTLEAAPPPNDHIQPQSPPPKTTTLPDPSAPSWEDNYRRQLYTSPRTSETDKVIKYTDSRGRGTYINTRTGQTVMPPRDPVTGRIKSESASVRSFGSRLTTRLVDSLDRKSNCGAGEARTPSPFVSGVLEGYKNPVFRPVREPSIPIAANQSTDDQATHAVLHGNKHNCSELDIQKAFKSLSGASGEIGRLSKLGLKNGRVVRQVDDKFILITIPEGGRDILVLVDQHAADERIRIEALMANYFAPADSNLLFFGQGYPGEEVKPGVAVEILAKPITFETSSSEAESFVAKQQWFAQWGIIFTARGKIFITALPPGIIERCRLEPKLIIDLMRKELYASLDKSAPNKTTKIGENTTADWLERIHGCPQGILDMLNSRACRSAIMFNDELSFLECAELVGKLGNTRFPFICAHGRPSMVPLVEVEGLGGYEEEKEISFAAWMGGGEIEI